MIDLSRNELPFSPPAAVVRRALRDLRRHLQSYPLELHDRVRAAVTARFTLDSSEAAIITRGVDDAVDAFLSHFADRIPVVLQPEFQGFVERLKARGARWLALPMTPSHTLPCDRLGDLDRRHVWMVSSPHNPTGRDFAPGDLRAPTARGAIVLMDRAYREFAKAPDANEQVGPGIFRFYSFSKAWALASFRLGVLVGPRRHIEKMRARQIYLGVDATSLRVLEAALAAGWAPEYAGRVARLRRALCSDLERREFPVVDTETNFVLVRERRAAVVRDHLESCRVRVATTDAQGLPGHLRISVGRSRDHAAVLRALESARGIMRR